MLFKKEFLLDLLTDDAEGVKVIKDEMIEHSRWAVHHEVIFLYQDKYYATYYRTGATEYQDERPYEDEGDEIECREMEPYEKVIIEYRPKK